MDWVDTTENQEYFSCNFLEGNKSDMTAKWKPKLKS